MVMVKGSGFILLILSLRLVMGEELVLDTCWCSIVQKTCNADQTSLGRKGTCVCMDTLPLK